MIKSRSYHQFCGLAKALDIIGERWTLLLVRELLLGPKRYSELLSTLPGLTTNLLAKRLKEMQKANLIEASGGAYALTPVGRALEPSVMALAAWGGQFLQKGPSRGDMTNIGWAALSMKRRFKGTQASGVLELRSDARRFQYVLSPAGLSLEENGARPADVTVEGEGEVIRGWFYRGFQLSMLEASKAVQIAGDRSLLLAFQEAFSLS